jgi:hypothetical protein
MKKLIPDVELKDTEFMSAKDKQLVLKHWTKFLAGGLMWGDFTKLLYEHLHLNCEFIAHYDRRGFYETYFVDGDDTVSFLNQFQGKCISVEYGNNYWQTSDDYGDVNREMVRIGETNIPGLIIAAQVKQKQADIAQALALLEKHGITLRGGE